MKNKFSSETQVRDLSGRLQVVETSLHTFMHKNRVRLQWFVRNFAQSTGFLASSVAATLDTTVGTTAFWPALLQDDRLYQVCGTYRGFDPTASRNFYLLHIESKKKKKKDASQSRRTSQQHVGREEAQNNRPSTVSRPGKKRLRKMKYQQNLLSPVEYLVFSAQNLHHTGSVQFLQRTSQKGASRTANVQVITSTDASTATSLPGIDKNTTCIHVQPLLVLDLNGILCHRIRAHREETNTNAVVYRRSMARIAGTPIIPRTDLPAFLSYLDKHFCLAIWTSAKNKTAMQLVKLLCPPAIANRLLFVWAQHRCNIVPNGDDGSDVPLFEKDLNKVWEQYPCWNANNTLLMDDSPDKCVAWHENAIHPPPLHGRNNLDNSEKKNDDALPDEVNANLQHEFFETFVQHWMENPLVQNWEEEGDASFHHVSSMSQVQFLQTHAKGHMGW